MTNWYRSTTRASCTWARRTSFFGRDEPQASELRYDVQQHDEPNRNGYASASCHHLSRIDFFYPALPSTVQIGGSVTTSDSRRSIVVMGPRTGCGLIERVRNGIAHGLLVDACRPLHPCAVGWLLPRTFVRAGQVSPRHGIIGGQRKALGRLALTPLDGYGASEDRNPAPAARHLCRTQSTRRRLTRFRRLARESGARLAMLPASSLA